MAESTHVIAFYKGDWADEMDVYGYWMTTREVWEEWLVEIDDYFPYTYCVGTNEEIEYSDKDALLADITVKGASVEQYRVFLDMHKCSIYGYFPEPGEDYEEDDEE